MVKVIGVRFRRVGKIYYFDPLDMDIKQGDHVIVETARGVEYGYVVLGIREVAEDKVILPLKPVIRIATPKDDEQELDNKVKEKDAFKICLEKIKKHGLEMKLIDAEYTFDNNKVLFYFTADGRIDFRELVKDLASVFKTRIELRQIGVRDETKILGGIGICGRPLCCSTYLSEFVPVSIKMAKEQSLSLNPTKISGVCGRLMCCLKYEQNAYEDAARRCPKQDSFVATPDGLGNVSSVDILREQVLVRLDGQNEGPKRYRTCEIQVLRNGKGSRDGIELPATLPERYQEPAEEEPQLTLSFFSSAKPIVPPEQWSAPAARKDAPASDEEEKEKRRSRRGGRGHRGGKGRGRANGEGGERAAAPKAEGTPEKGGDKPAEKRGERPVRGDRPSSERPPRNPDRNGERRAPRPGKPNAETGDAPKPPRPPRLPRAEGTPDGGENKPRRRSHRGGRGRRRSGGQGGESPAPKSEG